MSGTSTPIPSVAELAAAPPAATPPPAPALAATTTATTASPQPPLPPLPPSSSSSSSSEQLPQQQQALFMGQRSVTQTPPPLPPHPHTPDAQAHGHLTGAAAVAGAPSTPVTQDSTFTIPVSRAPLVLPHEIPGALTSKTVATLEDLLANTPALRGLSESLAFSPAPSPPPSASPAAAPAHSVGAITAGQTAAAHSNAALAQALATRIQAELRARRERAQAALHAAQAVEQEWLRVEAGMYKALQPYTMESLHARMVRAVTEAEQLSESLADSFLQTGAPGSGGSNGGDDGADGNEGGNGASAGDDISDFIRNYRKERKTYHMRKEILERWREERVARTY